MKDALNVFTLLTLAVAAATGSNTMHLMPGRGTEGSAQEPVVLRFRGRARDFAFFCCDVAITADGDVALIEANGSNAVSFAPADQLRVGHMVDTYLARGDRREGVALLPHRDGQYAFAPEFYTRASLFADALRLRGHDVVVASPHQSHEAGLAVVAGPISAIADSIETSSSGLSFRGREVVFATNPNLGVELIRRGQIPSVASLSPILHDGPCAPLVLDKAAQQEIARATGLMRPIEHFEAQDSDEFLAKVRLFLRPGCVVVIKMNAGSGGVGVELVRTVDEAAEALNRVLSAARTAYGPNADATVWPIGGFEFVPSRGISVDGRAHHFDIRFAVLVRPGDLEVVPRAIRVCPEPFDKRLSSRGMWVSNRTGRDPDPRLLLPCTSEALKRVAVDEPMLQRAAEACARWADEACFSSLKSNELRAIPFERECEAYDRAFYMPCRYLGI